MTVPALTVAADPEGAAEATADLLGRLIEEARMARGEAHVALAGGSTPRRAYELLAGRLESWDGVHLWLSDERVVSVGDPDSNHAMVAESLLARAEVAPERVHRVPVERGAREAAALYAADLRAALPTGPDELPVLDVALLGLGEDGHTASLFPGDSALSSGVGPCAAVERAPKPPPVRVTLTLEALGAARRVVFLAVGAEKRPAVEAVLAGPDPAVPASLVASEDGELIVDAEAAPEGDLVRDSGAGRRGGEGTGIHHVSLEVREEDVARCRDFYALLGFVEVRPPEALADRTSWLAREGQQLHLMLVEEPTAPPGGHFALVVDDYEGTLGALRGAGHDPEPRTEHWGSPRAFVRGPGGHLVELMDFPPMRPATDDQPRDSCLSEHDAAQGSVLWALLEDLQDWVHRRVETISVLDDTTVRRSVSVDFSVPSKYFAVDEPREDLPAVPLTFLDKEVLKRFDMRDAAGGAVPTLTKDQNGRAVGNALVHTVESWLQDRFHSMGALPGEVEREVRAVVEKRREEARKALEGWHHKADKRSGDEHQGLWDAIVKNAAILAAAHTLRDYFVLLAVCDPAPGRRQILKFAYNHVFKAAKGSRLGTTTGWQLERLLFEAPAVALSESYHLELLGVEDLLAVHAGMYFRKVEGGTPAKPPPKGEPEGDLDPDVHFNVARVDPAYEARAELAVRADPGGFVTAAALTAGLVALLMLGGYFRLSDVADPNRSQVTAALMLLAPAVVGAFIIRPGEHRLASRLLGGVRILLLINLASATLAVAALAGGLDGRTLCIWWLLMLFFGAASAVGLARPLLCPPSFKEDENDEVPEGNGGSS